MYPHTATLSRYPIPDIQCGHLIYHYRAVWVLQKAVVVKDAVSSLFSSWWCFGHFYTGSVNTKTTRKTIWT